MGAIRVEFLNTKDLCGPAGGVRAFNVLLDCWRAQIFYADLRADGDADNWLLQGTSCRYLFQQNTDTVSGAISGPVVTVGGFIHQNGAGRDAAPGNLNTTLRFTPVDATGAGLFLVIVKEYYDTGLIDPDFPG